MSTLRRQGIYAQSLPTKKSLTVQASDFSIGGIIGFFERKYKVAMLCNNPTEFQDKFGFAVNSAWYGSDAVKGFFDNIVGTTGKLYVKSHVGYTGSAYDAVAANATLVDQASSPLATLKIESAYQTELDFGVGGNRTGYKIVNGARFSTALNGASGSADTFIAVDSVAGIKVGDIIKIAHTSAIYKKVTQIDENAKKLIFSTAVGAVVADEVVVTVLGFQIKTFRKSITGIETEVETELGSIWCTMESEVVDYYVENVHSTNRWLVATDQSSASTLNESFPAEISTTTYLTAGADGTAPTTEAHWSVDLLAFDNLPVRMIANPETTVEAIQKAMETYCYGRDDQPKVIFNTAEDRTKAQLITIGNRFQRSNDVLGVIQANWYTVKDPFSTSSLSPDRHVPSVGHVMGAWIYAIGVLGIHYIPAVTSVSIRGITGIVGDTFLNDIDRTDLCNAGINVTQFIAGVGYVIKSFYTPSTTDEFRPANGILMREFFKVSIKDSLKDTINEPNSFARIATSRDAVVKFFYQIWLRGSTGNTPVGESFGQSVNEDGTPTKFADHVQIQADIFNNPQSEINVGNRNIDSWFSFPSPAGSIKIGVGLLLR